jgi:hypothetical protein
LSLRFTDGICPRCLDRFRSEHRRFLSRREQMATQESVGKDAIPLTHEGAA